MKRGSISERLKTLLINAEHEHAFYKYRMLSQSRMDIYERCNEIRFVECVYEYLIYAEDISKETVDALLKCKNGIFMTLYRVYLEREYTSIDTWEDIKNLIMILRSEQEKWSEA